MQEILFHIHTFGALFRLNWKIYHDIQRLSKHYERPGILPHWQSNKLAYYCFTGSGRKHRLLGERQRTLLLMGKKKTKPVSKVVP